MVFEEKQQNVILRIRLSPNSSVCKINGVFINDKGEAFLKISVISIPEKGKANEELIKFLAKALGIAKSDIRIIAGDTDRCKKLCISDDKEKVITKINQWLEEKK